CMQSLEFPFTL
nr:immunoglobulin light chain junction region [Macaca mulatta]